MREGKTALICGITGQDGSYLAKLLLGKGYRVYGTSRDVQSASLKNLQILGICDRIEVLSMQPNEFMSVVTTFEKSNPDEIYYLAGQSSVAMSFEQPAETLQSIIIGTLNVLEACRMSSRDIRIYQAGSSEVFGDTQGTPANEKTPFSPRSPYAVAKEAAYRLVDNYREAYGLYACTGLLFNHESPLRPAHFVTQKIITAANRIAKGSTEVLTLGRLDIERDWGWAPEYVEAMWKMLQQEAPEDFIIATGKTNSLEEFVRLTFLEHDLNWQNHVRQSDQFFRPTDLVVSTADPSKALERLGWQAETDMSGVIAKMTINEV